jgi:WD40 repeat protein
MPEPEANSPAEIQQTVAEARYAATSATGSASIQIINYNYSGTTPPEPPPLPGASPASEPDRPCPYRGLFHFGPNDAAVFFGRDAVVETLHRAIQRRPVLPLLGASGSGKSSVVFAGLVSRLEGDGHWRYSTFRPGADPFHALALALVPLYAPSLDDTERMVHARRLAEAMRKAELPLADVLAQVRHNAPQDQLLLIADQFEELYSLCPDEKVRRRFLDALIAGFAPAGPNGSATGGSVPRMMARLLLTMRADFLGSALAYRPFAEFFQQEGEGKGDVKLGPMNEAELREAIEKPAAAQSVSFQPGLVERILKDVAAEPGHLPLLEFALTELWSRRQGALLTHAAYTDIGGVEGALARHADASFALLGPDAQQEARRVLVQLVRPGVGTQDTRRLATRLELGEHRWHLVQRLADDRLVVTSRNAAGDDTVEVVHEALIRHWGELKLWLDADRSFRAWQDRLRNSLALYRNNNSEEAFLLQGPLLAEALDHLKERREEIASVELQFIEESAEAEKETQLRERRRRRSLFGCLIAGLVVLSLALLLAWTQLVQAQHLRGEALAVTAKLTVSSRPADALFEALAASGFGDFGLYSSATPYPISSSSTEALIEGLGLNREYNRFTGHLGQVRTAEFDAFGQKIVSAGEDGTVRLWDARTGQAIGEPLRGHKGWVRSAAFSSDGVQIVSAGKDGTIRLWDAKSGQEIGYPLIGHKGGVLSAEFSSDGQRIVSSGEDGTIRLWNVRNGQEDVAPLLGHQGWVRSAEFSPDGKWIVSAGEDGTVRIWNSLSGQLTIKPLKAHQGWVKTAAFSQDGERIVSAGYDGTVRVWDRKSGRAIGRPLRGHEGWVKTAAFSRDGERIVSAGEDGTIRLWDANTGQAIDKPLTGHQGWVLSAAFSNDGKSIVSAGQDGTVRLWKVNHWLESWGQLRGHQGSVRSASFSHDGERIVSAGDDGTVRIWDLKDSQSEGIVMRGHVFGVETVSFREDDQQIVSAGEDGTVRLWNAKTGQAIGEPLLGHQGGVMMASFRRDGLQIVSAGVDGTVRRWDAESGQQIGDSLLGHEGVVLAASFSDDGERIVSAGVHGTVRLWDAMTGISIGAPMLGHQEWIRSASFSPDGKRLMSADYHGSMRLWDVKTSQAVGQPIEGQQEEVRNASMSSDGALIVSAGNDGTLRLWDAKSLRAVGEPLRGHQGGVLSAAFSYDDKKIVSTGVDGSVRIWDPEWSDPIRVACRSLNNHQSLLNPTTDVEREAKLTCKRWGGMSLAS